MSLTLDAIDLSDTNFWLESLEYREAAFALLRREAPVKFFAELPFEAFPPGPGYWALTRYDDIWHASRNPQLFCSGKGSNIPDLPIEISEFFGSMINMDDPKHARLRGIVQKGFTPKMIKQAEDYVRERAVSVIDSPVGVLR